MTTLTQEHPAPPRRQGQRIRRGVRATLKRRVLSTYRETWSLKETCTRVGISKSTLHRWRKNDPRFDQKIEQCRNEIWKEFYRLKRLQREGVHTEERE